MIFFHVFFEDPGDHLIGETFEANVVVTKTTNTNYIFYTDSENASKSYRHTASTPWNLKGAFEASKVTPLRYDDRPPNTSISTNRFTIIAPFTCSIPGVARIRYDASISWNNESPDGAVPQEIQNDVELITRDTVRIESPPFRCLTLVTEELPQNSGTSVSSADPDNLSCNGADLLALELGGKKLEVVKLTDGNCYSVDQFINRSMQDACDDLHYHTVLRSINGVTRPDTDPCGAAKEGDVKGRAIIWISGAQHLEATQPVEYEVEIEVPDPSFQLEIRGGIFGE